MAVRQVLMPAFVFLLVAAGLLLFPAAFVHAQLVPQCVLQGGITCQACDLFKLVSNLIQYAIYLAIVIATILFSYAGWLYVSSGGSEEKVDKAKGIFKDVFFGIVIALLGFAIVDTIIKTVAAGTWTATWQSLPCVSGRQLGGSGLRFGNPYGAAFVSPEGLQETVNPYTGGITTGACTAQSLSASGMDNNYIPAASCICQRESGGIACAGMQGCGTTAQNSPDKLADGNVFSFGPFQFNLTQHVIQCNGQSVDCTKAFNKPSYCNLPTGQRTADQNRNCLGYGYTVADYGLYNQCIALATDPSCSTQYANKIFQDGNQTIAWGRSCGL